MKICGIEHYIEFVERCFGVENVMGSRHVRHALPQELGEGHFELFNELGQFQVWIADAQINHDIDMAYTQDEKSYIGMAYIETDTCRSDVDGGANRPIQSWRTARSLPSDGTTYGTCSAGKPLRAVNVILFQDFFLDCLDSCDTNRYFDILQMIQAFDQQTFMNDLYPLLAKILHSPYKDAAKKLFIKSEVFNIGAHLVALCDTEFMKPDLKLSAFDVRQLHRVPSILNGRLDDPPSIAELARMVTLNECKLKAGFKSVFNTTVYEYLRQLRTKKAIELMKEDLTLEQVAERVGYKSMRGFNQAFEKCSGATPGTWRKQSVRFSEAEKCLPHIDTSLV